MAIYTAQEIVKKLKKHGLSQMAIAKGAGLTQKQISYYERGLFEKAKIENMAKLYVLLAKYEDLGDWQMDMFMHYIGQYLEESK